MAKQNIEIVYTEKNLTDLPEEDQILVRKAAEAMSQAYAPYSKFRVGCTVRLANGEEVSGNNQENAAYPSGLCAERVALFAAKSHHQSPIRTIAIVAQNEANIPANAFSCGPCRQVMMEYANQQHEPIRILMQTERSTFIEVADVKELLPFHFNSDSLQ